MDISDDIKSLNFNSNLNFWGNCINRLITIEDEIIQVMINHNEKTKFIDLIDKSDNEYEGFNYIHKNRKIFKISVRPPLLQNNILNCKYEIVLEQINSRFPSDNYIYSFISNFELKKIVKQIILFFKNLK